MKVRIHYTAITGDYEAVEQEVKSLHQLVQQAHSHGGVFIGTHAEENFEFIPFHRLNGIEQLKEEAAPAPEVAPEEPKAEGDKDATQKGPEPEDSK